MQHIDSKRHTEYFDYHTLSDDQLHFYNEKGYLLLGRTLTDQGLELMLNQCMQAWTVEKGEFDPEKNRLQNALLTNIHQKSKIVRDYYFEGPLVDVAEQIIGPNIKAVTTQLTFKMRGNTMPFNWHQDNGYGELEPYNAISCLIALEDNDEKSGCLRIIPGSHKEGQVKIEHSSQDKDKYTDIRLEVDETHTIPVPLKAGECLFFNCWMLHKSEGNFSNDRDRRIIFMRYADADAVEVYNDRRPRLGRLVRGQTQFPEVAAYEADL